MVNFTHHLPFTTAHTCLPTTTPRSFHYHPPTSHRSLDYTHTCHHCAVDHDSTYLPPTVHPHAFPGVHCLHTYTTPPPHTYFLFLHTRFHSYTPASAILQTTTYLGGFGFGLFLSPARFLPPLSASTCLLSLPHTWTGIHYLPFVDLPTSPPACLPIPSGPTTFPPTCPAPALPTCVPTHLPAPATFPVLPLIPEFLPFYLPHSHIWGSPCPICTPAGRLPPRHHTATYSCVAFPTTWDRIGSLRSSAFLFDFTVFTHMPFVLSLPHTLLPAHSWI